MKANRFARDERAATAIVEELPVFIVITLAVGIFLVTGIRALASYKAGWAQQEEYEDAFEQAQLLRANPAFLKRGIAQAGEFDLNVVVQTQADINRGGVETGRMLLGIGAGTSVRILDASGKAATGALTVTDPTKAVLGEVDCPTRDCPVFAFANDVPDNGGRRIVHYVPASLSVNAVATHAALLEVTTWSP